MLADLIVKLAQMEQKDVPYSHRCSSASFGSRCLRSQVYHALKIPPKPFPGRAILIFEEGTWAEELTEDWIRKSVYKVHSEQFDVVPYQVNGKDVSGHIDWLLTDPNGEDFLIEHKAFNRFTFDSWEEGKSIPADQISQCCHYLVGLKKFLGKIIRAILLVKNKDTSRFIEYIIEYDDQTDIAKARLFRMNYQDNPFGVLEEREETFLEGVIQKAKFRFEEIDKYVETKTLPKRQYSINDWHCSYCRWFGVCYENYKKEVDNRKDVISLNEKDIVAKALDLRELMDATNVNNKKMTVLKNELLIVMKDKQAKKALAGKVDIEYEYKEEAKFSKTRLTREEIARASKVETSESVSVKWHKDGRKNVVKSER